MRSPCQKCDTCRVPRCNECSSCRNKKRCKQRGKCLDPKWVGKSPEPLASSPSVANPPSTSQSSPGYSGNNGSVSSAPNQSASSLSSPSQLTSNRLDPDSASSSSQLPLIASEASDSSSTPTPGASLLPSAATLFPFMASRLGSVDDVGTSRQGRSKARKRSLPAEEDSAPMTKKKTLQDEHEKMLVVEKEKVEVMQDRRGLKGVKYRCKKCGKIESCRISCIRHASKCGFKRKKVHRRGKSLKKHPCNLCGHEETTRLKLMKHRQKAHMNLMRRPRCWKCSRFFSSTKSYR